MRPLTVVSGIILGSAFSIAFGLLVVMIIFFVIGDKYPQVQGEFGALSRSLAVFITLTAVSAMSFFSLLKNRRDWWFWQLLTLTTVFMTGLYFWPA